MLFFDAHVHLQKNCDIDELLDKSSRNFGCHAQKFAGRPVSFFLLLAEIAGQNVFLDLRNKAVSDRQTNGWRRRETREPEALLFSRDDRPDWQFFLIAGRQVVSAERIEVLALATLATIADGLALDETIEEVLRQGGLGVLPWGVGKWLGKRGSILAKFLQETHGRGIFVGDNGGRPSFWPAPRLFGAAGTRGIRLLPGSDPLPLPEDEFRIGSYGGYLDGDVTPEQPASSLRRLLLDPSQPIRPFGSRMGIFSFLQAQIALRRLKRIR